MLVMTTIFISKMESLPPTSDIKMIDIWLILCQIYPFVEVVLLTAMEYQRPEENDKSDIVDMEPPFVMEQSDDTKPCLEKLVSFVSKWKAPNLKTLGSLIRKKRNTTARSCQSLPLSATDLLNRVSKKKQKFWNSYFTTCCYILD